MSPRSSLVLIGLVTASGPAVDPLFDDGRPPVLEGEIEVKVGEIPTAAVGVQFGELGRR